MDLKLIPEPSRVKRRSLTARLRGALHRRGPISGRQSAVWLIIAACLLAGPLVSHLHKAFHPTRPHGDWYSIYAIGRYSIETGELEADEGDPVVRTQRYPPITRPLLMLLAAPPKAVAAVLSFAVFAGLYCWSAWQVSRIFFEPSRFGRWAGVTLAVVLVMPYVWADLTAGNLTSVLLASVTGAFVLSRRGRPCGAGLVLSIGIMLKIIPVLCLLYFVVRGKWRVVWGVVFGVVLLGILPSLVLFGPKKLWNYHGYWYRTQFLGYTPMSTIDHPTEYSYQNQSVVRTMVRLFTSVNAGSSGRPFHITIAQLPRSVLKVAYLGIMIPAGLGLVWFLWLGRGEDAPRVCAGRYALCVGSMLWFTPWVGSYYFSLAIWPAAALVGRLLEETCEPAQRRWVWVVVVLWLLAMPAMASRLLRAVGTQTWCSALLLVVLVVVERRPRKGVTAPRLDHLA